jgi:hypothetical protein
MVNPHARFDRHGFAFRHQDRLTCDLNDSDQHLSANCSEPRVVTLATGFIP